ncbi:hypothetical protein MTR_5g049510 [Medicago truncatula]|uniref:F-box protein interaction domain protein n=1 Tax=Medicago truncatula TaxID=3880 RepID=G7ZUX4_MEDTR|nr:hypothetical protein MTR_5g049510 [Medicago truncatula]
MDASFLIHCAMYSREILLYEPSRREFNKLIKFISSIPSRCWPSVSFWDMYSPNSNTWRTIDVDMLRSSDNVDVHMDGVCHSWAQREAYAYLVSFDLAAVANSMKITPITT